MDSILFTLFLLGAELHDADKQQLFLVVLILDSDDNPLSPSLRLGLSVTQTTSI